MTAPTVAAIDIGTNSVLLSVARRTPGGAVESVVERATITRIGRGVDRTGRLAPEGIEATLRTLQQYVEEARSAGASRIGAVATSAVRDADNAQDFLEPAGRILSAPVEVITGLREAELTFRGAVHGLDLEAEEVTVVDVGGGSTELVRGRTGRLDDAVSLDIGSVRLFERHITGDPPSEEELASARDAIREALRTSRLEPRAPLVGIAGTVTTLAAIWHAIEPYDPGRVHGARLSANMLASLLHKLTSLPLTQRRELPGLEPERADVIVTGALIVRCAVEQAGADELVVSNGGVRVGLAQELL